MAYGAVPSPPKASPLDVRAYSLPARAASVSAAAIISVPLDIAAGDEVPVELETRLREVFNEELEKGVTYPQRGPMSVDEFRGYFVSYDLIVGVVVGEAEALRLLESAADGATSLDAVPMHGLSLDSSATTKETLLAERDWVAAYGFSYYIKPNYPGRSSHLCNAGFVVPPQQRGRGLGGIAGRTFVHYGPRCGYRGSVFNLVYANNAASVQIWERLGFARVGKIPQAGLLRKQHADGTLADKGDEEYVDAWVVYGDFDKLAQMGMAAKPAIASAPS